MGISFAQLRALNTDGLSTAADAAVLVGKDLDTRADEITDAAKATSGSEFWGGADAQAQNALLNTFPPPLHAAGTVFKTAAGAIDALVTELDGAKADLERAITSYPEHTVHDDGTVTWPPSGDPARAEQLKTQATDLFNLLQKALQRAQAADDLASGQLANNDLGSGNGPVQVKLPDGSVYLATGDEADDVDITEDGDGDLVVTVDGKEFRYEPGTPLVLDTGGGEDTVDIDGSVSNDITVDTGSDNDTVTDDGSTGPRTISTGDGDDKVTASGDSKNIFGGDDDDTIDGGDKADVIDGGEGGDVLKGHDGDDFISGGDGHDYIDGQDGNDKLDGGTGNDHVYGLDGDDRIAGGAGDDSLEGGQNNDVIDGGDGKDVVSGGYGDDDLRGGGDDDRLYAGGGKDTLDGGEGDDDAFAQKEDTVTSAEYTETRVVSSEFIKIEGSEEYQDRVRADLDMIGSSPKGGEFFDSLRDKLAEGRHDLLPGEEEIVFKELDGRSNADQGPWPGSDAVIEFDPDEYTHGASGYESSSTVYHELAHQWDNIHDKRASGFHEDPNDPDTEDGVGVPNTERQVTGLPFDRDGDGVSENPRDTDAPHPYDFTQNAFNEETGRDPLTHYGSSDPPQRRPNWWERFRNW